MYSDPLGWITCCATGCPSREQNDKWQRIRADGWFTQKDGTNYCPDHVPDWVEAWREKKSDY